jgi:hypothetical protein
MMAPMSKGYPWRDRRTVTQVVNDHRDLLVRAGMIEEGPGHSAKEIQEFRAGQAEPAPPELIELYRAARPRQIGADHWPNIGLFTLSDEEPRWHALLEERPHPIDIIWWRDEPVPEDVEAQWRTAKGFELGGTPFFDRLFILKGHASVPDGSILLTDHESDHPMAIVARSLAEYLARFCHFDGLDLIAYPGECESYPREMVMTLAREYMELNPQSEEDFWKERARA